MSSMTTNSTPRVNGPLRSSQSASAIEPAPAAACPVPGEHVRADQVRQHRQHEHDARHEQDRRKTGSRRPRAACRSVIRRLLRSRNLDSRLTPPRPTRSPPIVVDNSAGRNQSAISRSADSGLSLPWTRLFCLLIEKSPRTVPGAAAAPLVAPSMRPDDRDRLVPFQHADDHRRTGDELDQPLEERLALVLGVVLLGQAAVDADQLERGDPQALGLEACEDRADQPALDTIGLEDDQGALHGTQSRCRSWDDGNHGPVESSMPGVDVATSSSRRCSQRSGSTIRQGSSWYESGSSRQTRTSGIRSSSETMIRGTGP